MIQLKQPQGFTADMAQGFNVKIGVLGRATMIQTAAQELDQQLMDRVNAVQAPLYFGEAERLLLNPLFGACSTLAPDADNLATASFRKAASYSIIEELAKLSSPKDLASAMSFQMIQSLPIVQRMAFSGLFNQQDNGFAPTLLNTGGAHGGPAATVENGVLMFAGKPVEAWGRILSLLRNIPVQPSDQTVQPVNEDHPVNQVNAYDVLASIYSLGDIADCSQTVADDFNMLSRFLKYGKGFPLARNERETYLQDRFYAVVTLLHRWFHQIMTGGLTAQQLELVWANYLTAYKWFTLYLNTVEDYDTIFPAGAVQTQSSAWALSLKTNAAKFKSFYLQIATAAMSESLEYSRSLWEDAWTWLQPTMPPTAAAGDVHKLFSEYTEMADKISDEWAKSLATETLARIKTSAGVDIVLEDVIGDQLITLITHLQGDADNHILDAIDMTADGSGVPKGLEALNIPMLMSAMVHLSDQSRLAALARLTAGLSNLKAAASAVVQTADFVNGFGVDPGAYKIADIPAFKFNSAAPMITVDPIPMTFDRRDALVRSCFNFQELADASGTYRWFWIKQQFVNTPQRARTMADTIANNSDTEPSLYWPDTEKLTLGDPLIVNVAKAPVCAHYTRRITKEVVPATWESWLRIYANMDSSMLGGSEMLNRMAALITSDRDRYAVGIANMLAAYAFVYTRDASGGIWELAGPSIPSIYGCPTPLMVSANDWMSLATAFPNAYDFGRSTFIAPTTALGLTHEQRVWLCRTADGHEVAFVLHGYYPRLFNEDYRLVVTEIFRGSYILSRVSCAWLENGGENMDPNYYPSLLASFTELHAWTESKWVGNIIKHKDDMFVLCKEWNPTLLLMPHALWHQNEFMDWTTEGANIYSFALTRVLSRVEPGDKSMSLIAIVDNPQILIEQSDVESVSCDSPHQGTVAIESDQPDTTQDSGAVGGLGTVGGPSASSTLTPPPSVAKAEAGSVMTGTILTGEAETPQPDGPHTEDVASGAHVKGFTTTVPGPQGGTTDIKAPATVIGSNAQARPELGTLQRDPRPAVPNAEAADTNDRSNMPLKGDANAAATPGEATEESDARLTTPSKGKKKNKRAKGSAKSADLNSTQADESEDKVDND